MPKPKSILRKLRINEVSVCPVGMHKGARIELFKADQTKKSVPAASRGWTQNGDGVADGGNMSKIDLSKVHPDQRQLVQDAVEKADRLEARVAELEANDAASNAKPIDKAALAPDVRAALEKAEADAKDSNDRLIVLEKRDNERVLLTKAASLGDIAIEPEKLLDLLRKAQTAGFLDEQVEALKSQGLALTEARKHVTDERGTARVSAGGGSAYGELLAKAEDIRKAEPKVTREQAIERASQENPEVYNRYLAEHPAQTGRAN